MAGPLLTDRRATAARLTAFTVTIVAVFGMLAVAFWYFQIVEGATYVRMAENNHLRRLSLRAPRGVMFDRDGTLLVENRDAFTISILREHSAGLDQTIRRLAAVAGVDEQEIRETIRRHRGEPSYRPITVIDDATLSQVSAVLARRLALRTAWRRRRARAHAALPLGRPRRARARLRRRSRRGPDGRGEHSQRVGGGAVRRREDLQQAADGHRRRAPGDGGQRRPRDLDAGRSARVRGAAGQADHRLRAAAGRRRRLPRAGLRGGRRDPRSPQRGGAGAGEPARVRPQRLRRGHRPGDVEPAEHRPPAAAAEPRHPGALLAGLDLQGGRGGGRPRRRASSRPISRSRAAAAGPSSAGSSSAT